MDHNRIDDEVREHDERGDISQDASKRLAELDRTGKGDCEDFPGTKLSPGSASDARGEQALEAEDDAGIVEMENIVGRKESGEAGDVDLVPDAEQDVVPAELVSSSTVEDASVKKSIEPGHDSSTDLPGFAPRIDATMGNLVVERARRRGQRARQILWTLAGAILGASLAGLSVLTYSLGLERVTEGLGVILVGAAVGFGFGLQIPFVCIIYFFVIYALDKSMRFRFSEMCLFFACFGLGGAVLGSLVATLGILAATDEAQVATMRAALASLVGMCLGGFLFRMIAKRKRATTVSEKEE